MKRTLILCAAVLYICALAGNVRAAMWTDVDGSFQITAYSAPFTDPTTYTIQAKNISANNYTNVHFVIPFHYEIDALPPTTATAYAWNNATKKWENGGNSIAIYGVGGQNDLVLMSDTDIPLTFSIAPAVPGGNTSILATDSVPIIPIGDISAGQTFTFNIQVDFSPNAIKSLGGGLFVVPEPSAMGLLGVAGAGLLRRRKRSA